MLTLAPSLVQAAPLARVHVNAPRPAFLHRRAAGTADFVVACEVPCDLELPIEDTYKISGNGFQTTRELHLTPGPDGLAELTVDGPNVVGMVGGGIIGGFGVLVGYLGFYLGMVEGLTSDGHGSGGALAGVGLGVGAGFVGLGALILLPSMRTDVRGTCREIEREREPSRDPVDRAPNWRSARSEPGDMPPTTWPVVFGGRF